MAHSRKVKLLMRLPGSRISAALRGARGCGWHRRSPRSGPVGSGIGSHCLCPGDFARCERTAPHNTPQHQLREVHYPWHTLYGKTVVIHGHLLKQGQELCRCLLPGQEARIGFEIPAWMLDRAHCTGSTLKTEPHVSCQALVALKQLWDEALAPMGGLTLSRDCDN